MKSVSSDEKNNIEVDVERLGSAEDSVSLQQDAAHADDAFKYAKLTKGLELTPELDRKLRRKADIYVLPLICVAYAMQFLDRSTTSYGAIMGLREDLKMVGDQYNWLMTTVYITYLFWSFPGSWTLQKFPLSKTVAAYVGLWGLTTALQAACYSYKSLVVARAFLGIFESPLLPGLALLSSNFYHKSEVFSRTCYYFAFTGLANILGSAISYGINLHKDNFAIAAWRALFAILGSATVLLAILMVIFIPDLPTKAWWLTEEEKLLTVERIRANEQGFGNSEFKWYQVKEALLDYKVWIYPLLAVAIEIPNSGISSFASILLKETFEFDTNKALLMKAPMGGVQLGGLTLLGLASQYKLIKHPLIVAMAGVVFATIGGFMLAFCEEKHARLAGFYLVGFSPSAMITALSCLATNVAGRTKKVVANAIYLVGFCASSAVGPQVFLPSEAPKYRTAIINICVFYCFGLGLLIILAFANWNNNRSRDKERDALGDKYVKVENSEFLDLTDKENRDFRYVW
ncbi:allantoate permease [[Candida] jaroonii]|uniref:Allantoate permease n=1 Tax=[Candida] jaroonii TaxID=467808 RepID=A0ACA9YDX0_9ASCO|nr:allantoate permease [[Candida] jaroonii]